MLRALGLDVYRLWNGAIAKSYGVIGLPTSFLIGLDGRALARAVGPREWVTTGTRALERR